MSPSVYIISRPHFDDDSFRQFLESANTTWRKSPGATVPEQLVEAAGRVCYMSFGNDQSPKSNEEYIRHLIKMGHESVLEHVNWTLLIEGVSRAFSHQLVRHRAGFAFSQLSQQYHDESGAEFVEPMHLDRLPEAQAAWQGATEKAQDAYRQILNIVMREESSAGIDNDRRESLRKMRSMARSVLPNATETKIVVTANARAIRHFLRVRGCITGDLEMRHVAAQLLRLLRNESPSLFFDFHLENLSDGSPIVKHCTDGQ